jgi:formylglycine-generating enzyme required for sulfatase activity
VTYAKWRTDRVNEKLYLKKHKIDYKIGEPIPNLPKVVEYRLPTKEEWEKIAQVAYSKKGQRKFRRKKYSDKEQYNFLNKESTEKEDTLKKDYNFPRYVKAFYPNSLSVYDILGNVAEMTATKGIAKGGAYIHKAEEVTVEKDFSYSKPSKWLGFRCVCEKMAVE